VLTTGGDEDTEGGEGVDVFLGEGGGHDAPFHFDGFPFFEPVGNFPDVAGAHADEAGDTVTDRMGGCIGSVASVPYNTLGVGMQFGQGVKKGAIGVPQIPSGDFHNKVVVLDVVFGKAIVYVFEFIVSFVRGEIVVVGVEDIGAEMIQIGGGMIIIFNDNHANRLLKMLYVFKDSLNPVFVFFASNHIIRGIIQNTCGNNHINLGTFAPDIV